MLCVINILTFSILNISSKMIQISSCFIVISKQNNKQRQLKQKKQHKQLLTRKPHNSIAKTSAYFFRQYTHTHDSQKVFSANFFILKYCSRKFAM